MDNLGMGPTSPQKGLRDIGLLVIIDIVSIVALLAIGYFWIDGKFKQLESRIDIIATEQDNSEGPASGTPSVTPPVAPVTTYKSKHGDSITVDTPIEGAPVSSPLKVKGHVPGSWFFEGQFSVFLKDSSGNVVAKGPTDVSKDWQTSGQVDFTATLTWTKTVSGKGTLVLEKSNPSGLAKNDDSVSIALTF